jgi:N-acetyltransferase
MMSKMQIFDPTKEYILENDTVLLRPLVESDYEHLLPFALNEPEIWKFSLVPASGADGMRNYIVAAIEARVEGTEYAFIVFDKRTQQYAGSTRFYDIQLHNQSVQLGYTWYGAAFQGTGLNKNCKLLLLQFAFDELGLERVEFRADNNNEKSKAAMKSIGCVEEAVLRSHLDTYTGVRRSSIILSILKSEWDGVVKERLMQKIKEV